MAGWQLLWRVLGAQSLGAPSPRRGGVDAGEAVGLAGARVPR